MTHSPGPWKREGYGGTEIVAADGEGVCRLYKVDGAKPFDPTTPAGDTTEDNCELVMAAPDMKAEIARLRNLVSVLIDNDPDDVVADGGITVLMVWRSDAARALGRPQPQPYHSTITF